MRGLALTALVLLPVTAATAVVSADHETPHGSVTATLAQGIATPAAQAPDPCHGTGALIRTRSGKVRQVSLARGLRTYEHKAPGSFLRLCGVTPAGATPQRS